MAGQQAEGKEEGCIKNDAQSGGGFTPTDFQEWAYGGGKTSSLGSIELEASGGSSWRKYRVSCQLWAWNSEEQFGLLRSES